MLIIASPRITFASFGADIVRNIAELSRTPSSRFASASAAGRNSASPACRVRQAIMLRTLQRLSGESLRYDQAASLSYAAPRKEAAQRPPRGETSRLARSNFSPVNKFRPSLQPSGNCTAVSRQASPIGGNPTREVSRGARTTIHLSFAFPRESDTAIGEFARRGRAAGNFRSRKSSGCLAPKGEQALGQEQS